MVPSLTPIRPKNRRVAGRAIVALSDRTQADMILRVLRRMGWNTAVASRAEDVRRFVTEAPGSVVILGPELADESGWLTCAKLTQPVARATVLMVGADTPRNRMMARTAGAATLLADPVEVAEWV